MAFVEDKVYSVYVSSLHSMLVYLLFSQVTKNNLQLALRAKLTLEQPRPRPSIFSFSFIFLIFSAFSHEKTGTR